jgi:hypothetical protein
MRSSNESAPSPVLFCAVISYSVVDIACVVVIAGMCVCVCVCTCVYNRPDAVAGGGEQGGEGSGRLLTPQQVLQTHAHTHTHVCIYTLFRTPLAGGALLAPHTDRDRQTETERRTNKEKERRREREEEERRRKRQIDTWLWLSRMSVTWWLSLSVCAIMCAEAAPSPHCSSCRLRRRGPRWPRARKAATAISCTPPTYDGISNENKE